MTQRNWILFCVKKRLKELNFFFWNWAHRKELNPLLIWLKELKSFFAVWRQWVQLFLCSDMTQRVGPFFEYDSKNSTFFLPWLERIEPFFFKYDSNTWTFVWVWLKEVTQRSEPSFMNFTQRIELFFVNTTQRSESFFEHDSKKWTFLNITQRIEPFFSIRRKELNLFSKYDSKNWPFFLNMIQRKEPFLKMTQRIELFFLMWLKELNLFLNMIQGIEFLSDIYDSKSKNRTSFFFQYDSKNRTLFFCMWFMFSNDLKNFFFVKISQRIDFSYDSKNGTWRRDLKFMFLEFDSKNWTFFMTRRLEVFFQKLWRKDFFLKNMTQRIDPFLYDSKNWTLFCMTQRIEPFFVWLKELNPFLYDAKNWTLLLWIWRRELNLLFWFAAKNWVFFC